MRLNKQAIRELRKRRKTSEITLPAPFGGWDTISALADMPEDCASILDNWYPDIGSVRVRMGHEQHATGIGSGLVQTAHEYNVGSNRKLLAASATTIYNASASGAASSLLAGQTNGKWQVATMTANQLWANGADTPQVFDGSSFSAWTGTGPTPAFVVGCHVHRHRMYVWENNSTSFWYGATSAITGAFAEFPLGEVSQVGGNLVAMATWTLDSGNGPDDMAVFFMSSGMFIIYAGNDPGDSEAWALKGIFKCGAPLGIRAVSKDGGDVRVLTHEDVVLMTQTMQTGDDSNVPSKVRKAMTDSAAGASSTFGWDICQYPRGGMIIHNIPQASGAMHQYVQNMATKAWCRYTGLEAQCWTVFNNELYFGGAGGILFKAETGNDDNGDAILADALTAWTRVQIPNRKRVAAVRPVIKAAQLEYNFAFGFDFETPIVETPSIITQSGAPWDTSLWDVTQWSQENQVAVDWEFAEGSGTHIAQRFKVNAETAVEWFRSDLLIEPGRGL